MAQAISGSRIAAGLLCALLAACGGGGGGTSAANDSGGSNLAPVSNSTSEGTGGQQSETPDQQQADATQARFNHPTGLALDGNGNLYVADSDNFTVRKIGADGSVTTLAGSPGTSGSSDGSGAAARFSNLTGIAVDGAGNVYVADNSAIRKITPAGVVSTLAGVSGAPGDADGIGGAAGFNHPWGIAASTDGTVYVADTDNYLVRAINPAGVVTTVAGTRGVRGRADGANASFLNPKGIALDTAGNLYVTDWYGPPAPNIPEGSTLMRKIANGSVSTLAGNMAGEAGPAQFRDTYAIATDGTGNIYVAAQSGVKRITPEGAVTTVFDAPTQFQSLEGLASDATGNLYVADRPAHALSRVNQSGAISLYAGKPGESGSNDTL